MDGGEPAVLRSYKGERVPLAALTTLRVGGEADVVDCENEEEITALLAREQGRQLFILGNGSNVLAPDEGYAGIVLRPRIRGISFSKQPDGTTLVAAGAGVLWDELVATAVAQGLWGLENLSGIPGTVGGAVVQNIGAYGAALSQTLRSAEGIDIASGERRIFTLEECRFGYRDSLFKHEGGKFVITRAAFTLSETPSPNLSYRDPNKAYRDVATALGAIVEPALSEMRSAILSVRAQKFPDLSKEGTAGSFFENPILPEAEAKALQARYPEMPLFPMPESSDLKIPLAWILDHVLGLRGYTSGHVRLFDKQALVLVTSEGATADEVNAFADGIAKKVFDATGIKIMREVETLG